MSSKRHIKLKRLEIENWFTENSKIVNVSALERELHLSKGRIQSYLKYGRTLNAEEIEVLHARILKLCIHEHYT